MKAVIMELKVKKKIIKKKYGVFFASENLNVVTDDIIIEGPSRITSSVALSGDIKIGAFTYFCNGGLISNINIGRYCSVATDVKIGLGIHPTNWLSTSPFQYINNVCNWAKQLEINKQQLKEFVHFKTVKIGNDVWVGAGAVVIDGVSIGDGAVIGANAVVTKDIPPYAIAVGIPAKIIKYRFDEETIKELLDLQWWKYSMSDLDGIDFDDIKKAISQIKDRVNSGQITEYKPEVLTKEKLLKCSKKI